MPKIDIPTKRLIQIRPEDWVKVIFPNYDQICITEMKTDKVPKVESRLDALLFLETREEDFILNIEPQGYYDKAMPVRMLRYRADVWEYTLRKGMGLPHIKQVVIFFNKEHDNKQSTLIDKWQGKEIINFEYDVIRVWELKKNKIIEKHLYGLYPLLPLMEKELGETDDKIIETTVKEIQTVKEESLKADLLAAMSLLASEKYSRDLVRKYVRREMLMNSPLFDEWVEEERVEVAIKEKKKYIIELIQERFDIISKSTKEKIEQINDKEVLDNLFRKAIRIHSLEEFEKLVDRAIKLNY